MNEIKICEFSVLEFLDEVITSVRDTNYHEVMYGEDGCDGRDTGVIYDEVECSIHEAAETLQARHNNMASRIVELEKSLQAMTEFAEHQMHPEVNDPSMFNDGDFGDLTAAKKLLEQSK